MEKSLHIVFERRCRYMLSISNSNKNGFRSVHTYQFMFCLNGVCLLELDWNWAMQFLTQGGRIRIWTACSWSPVEYFSELSCPWVINSVQHPVTNIKSKLKLLHFKFVVDFFTCIWITSRLSFTTQRWSSSTFTSGNKVYLYPTLNTNWVFVFWTTAILYSSCSLLWLCSYSMHFWTYIALQMRSFSMSSTMNPEQCFINK